MKKIFVLGLSILMLVPGIPASAFSPTDQIQQEAVRRIASMNKADKEAWNLKLEKTYRAQKSVKSKIKFVQDVLKEAQLKVEREHPEYASSGHKLPEELERLKAQAVMRETFNQLAAQGKLKPQEAKLQIFTGEEFLDMTWYWYALIGAEAASFVGTFGGAALMAGGSYCHALAQAKNSAKLLKISEAMIKTGTGAFGVSITPFLMLTMWFVPMLSSGSKTLHIWQQTSYTPAAMAQAAVELILTPQALVQDNAGEGMYYEIMMQFQEEMPWFKQFMDDYLYALPKLDQYFYTLPASAVASDASLEEQNRRVKALEERIMAQLSLPENAEAEQKYKAFESIRLLQRRTKSPEAMREQVHAVAKMCVTMSELAQSLRVYENMAGISN